MGMGAQLKNQGFIHGRRQVSCLTLRPSSSLFGESETGCVRRNSARSSSLGNHLHYLLCSPALDFY